MYSVVFTVKATGRTIAIEDAERSSAIVTFKSVKSDDGFSNVKIFPKKMIADFTFAERKRS